MTLYLDMMVWKYRPSLVELQLLIWAAVLLLVFFSLLPMDGFNRSVIYTIVNTTSYAVIIYGNILVLYPVLYEKRKFIWYAIAVALFLSTIGILRGYCTISLYRHFLLTQKSANLVTLLGYIPGGILIYILSLIFRISIVYFALKRQTEEIILQKTQAELNLLKSQVQPHFLFNTLNNIYYKVYKVDPLSAGLIERLSGIMRYFVDDSMKTVVPISVEVEFIENYIALESIRVRYGVTVDLKRSYDHDLHIPPMLLMPLIENTFKHGIDRSKKENSVSISLTQEDGCLILETHNNRSLTSAPNGNGGFGLANLDQRLRLLYGSRYELLVNKQEISYTALLKIPLL